MDLKLTGKTALITGGSKGIGKAIARALAEEGVDVAIAARDMTAANAAAKEIASATGRKVIAVQTDTGDDAKVKAMVAETRKALGKIDILVNCAAQPGGQAKPPALGEITNEHFWADMNVKVLGYLRTSVKWRPLKWYSANGAASSTCPVWPRARRARLSAQCETSPLRHSPRTSLMNWQAQAFPPSASIRA